MGKASRPALITLALSAMAVLGYVAYRLNVPPGGTGPDSTARASAEQLVEELPEFALENLVGEPQPITSWPGQPLVINFWATWCAPCLREIPMLKTFQDAHPWLTVVGIAVDGKEAVHAFAEHMDFNYPILVGQAEAVNAAASFGVDFVALPFTVFTDHEGHTLGVRTGELRQEHLDHLLATLEDLVAGRIGIENARARLAGVM